MGQRGSVSSKKSSISPPQETISPARASASAITIPPASNCLQYITNLPAIQGGRRNQRGLQIPVGLAAAPEEEGGDPAVASSAKGTASQIPVTPTAFGSRTSATIRKPKVRRKEMAAETRRWKAR